MANPDRRRNDLAARRRAFDDRPAPVVSEEGTFGTLPRSPRPFERGGGGRGASLWIVGTVFAVLATVWLIALSASQLTDARVALAVHERGLAALTEIDALLALHVDDIVVAASGSAEVTLPGFPVPGVTLTAAEAATGDAGIMRDALLARAAALVYEGGLEVMNDPDGLPIATSTFSTAGGVRRVMELLSATNHERAGLVLWPAGIAALVAAAGLLALGRGPGRLIALGVALTAAGVMVLLFAGLIKVVVVVAGSDGSTLAEAFAAMARTLTWLPARNALLLGAGGLAIVVPALVARVILDRSVRETAALEA